VAAVDSATESSQSCPADHAQQPVTLQTVRNTEWRKKQADREIVLLSRPGSGRFKAITS
jgi:hypothetical protein